jgi:hypothetical protein
MWLGHGAEPDVTGVSLEAGIADANLLPTGQNDANLEAGVDADGGGAGDGMKMRARPERGVRGQMIVGTLDFNDRSRVVDDGSAVVWHWPILQ